MANGSALVHQLPLYIQLAYVGATGMDSLRVAGLRLMQTIINTLGAVPDPLAAGHLYLEQYQAQIDSALKQNLAAESSPLAIGAAAECIDVYLSRSPPSDASVAPRYLKLLVRCMPALADPQKQAALSSDAAIAHLACLGTLASVYVAAVSNAETARRADADDEFATSPQDALRMIDDALRTVRQPLGEGWVAAFRDCVLLYLCKNSATYMQSAGRDRLVDAALVNSVAVRFYTPASSASIYPTALSFLPTLALVVPIVMASGTDRSQNGKEIGLAWNTGGLVLGLTVRILGGGMQLNAAQVRLLAACLRSLTRCVSAATPLLKVDTPMLGALLCGCTSIVRHVAPAEAELIMQLACAIARSAPPETLQSAGPFLSWKQSPIGTNVSVS
jgi:hypothetical protein